MIEDPFTLPGGALPGGEVPPTLLFHRWQQYDAFADQRRRRGRKELEVKAFDRKLTGSRFLRRVATSVQDVNRGRFSDWHTEFVRAVDRTGTSPVVEGEVPWRMMVEAQTQWRMVVGWGTNPALEVGITLDHLLGFPFIPGSAVKGLLHTVAEQCLLGESGFGAPLPQAPASLPSEPPAELDKAVQEALLVREVFGSLHLERGNEGQPEAPRERLEAWQALLPEPEKRTEGWTNTASSLDGLVAADPTGGMLICYDAVPAPTMFEMKRELLTVDVLTPHVGGSPNPIHFLAVRDGATFEFRFALRRWPSRQARDEEERGRRAALGSLDRVEVLDRLRRWLERGLGELGLGGKTSAGYGYLLAGATSRSFPVLREEPPPPPSPEDLLSEEEREALKWLPDDVRMTDVANLLDNAFAEASSSVQSEVAHRFRELFPDMLAKWRTTKKAATVKRVAAIDTALAARGEEEK